MLVAVPRMLCEKSVERGKHPLRYLTLLASIHRTERKVMFRAVVQKEMSATTLTAPQKIGKVTETNRLKQTRFPLIEKSLDNLFTRYYNRLVPFFTAEFKSCLVLIEIDCPIAVEGVQFLKEHENNEYVCH